MFNVKPSCDHMKFFSCLCYAHKFQMQKDSFALRRRVLYGKQGMKEAVFDSPARSHTELLENKNPPKQLVGLSIRMGQWSLVLEMNKM